MPPSYKIFPDNPLQGILIVLKGQFLWRTWSGNQATTKAVSPQDVRQAGLEIDLDTGWLPTSMNLLRWGMDGRQHYTFVVVPPGIYQFFIEEQGKPKLYKAPFPRLIFSSRLHGYFCWAVYDEAITGESKLFHAPFPNIDSNGLICWGDNTYHEPGPAQIHAAWTTFLRSPFNEHSAQDKSANYRSSVNDLWRKLAKARAKDFPDGELLPMRKTLDEMFDLTAVESYSERNRRNGTDGLADLVRLRNSMNVPHLARIGAPHDEGLGDG